jgi:transcriptional regulator with XRE-family HTH domain
MRHTGEVIRQLREEAGLTQAAVGKLVGMSGVLVSRREKGDIRIKPPEMKLWAKAFGISLDQFLERMRQGQKLHDRPAPTKIPIINRGAAGTIVDFDHSQFGSGEYHEAMQYEDRDAATQHGELFGVVVVGDSMQPNILENDILIFHPVDGRRGSPDLRDGLVVHVRFAAERPIQGNGIYRMFWASADKKTIRLAKDNPRYPSITLPLNVENIARIASFVQLRRVSI